MSAFDIAGAVVATPLAIVFWKEFIMAKDWDGSTLLAGLVVATCLSIWAAFCIARLCGASL